jgi:glycosyltransferase involved in cell wall biosynthesis
MNIIETPELQLEILVSTINRNSLDFLKVMFQNSNLSDHKILVVNQTTENCTIDSKDPKIRVINSFEKGLSKSRNLAIENAIGDVCLLADDDAVFVEGFEKLILKSYETLDNADVITFKTLTTENKPFSNYPKGISELGSFCKYVLSIEISFKRKSILNSSVRFDEQFGLGATFQDSENYIFLLELLKHKKCHLFFVPEFVVIHKPFTSSDDIVSDRFVFARSALNYKLHKQLAYFWLMKYIFFLLRNGYIKFSNVKDKWSMGIKGIYAYQELSNK